MALAVVCYKTVVLLLLILLYTVAPTVWGGGIGLCLVLVFF